MPINNVDYTTIKESETSDNIRIERSKIPVGNLSDDITLNTTGKTLYVMSNGSISGQKSANSKNWTKYGGGKRKSKKSKRSRKSRKTRKIRKTRRSRK
jgi:hypothetical protein